MTPRIFFTSALFHCDGIQVFDGRDEIGGHFIAVMAGETDEGDPLYSLFGVSPVQLQQFRLGNLDLRTLIVNRPLRPWFVGQLVERDGQLIVEVQAQADDVPSDLLPDEGFTLSIAPAGDAWWVRRESQSRSTLAWGISVDSGVPTDEHRLGASKLGGLLLHIQNFVKYAYRKVCPGARDRASSLDVAVPAAPGSLAVLLVPSQLPDLFDKYEVASALDVVDFLLGDVSDPQQTLERVKKYAGHTAGAFVRLLKFLNDAEISLQYSWTAPDRPTVSVRSLTQRDAQSLLVVLSATNELQTEKLTLAGRLRKVDIDAGTWRILSVEDGKEYAGKTRGGIGLGSLVTDQNYVFQCEEQVEEVTGTGREIRTIYLIAPPTQSTLQ